MRIETKISWRTCLNTLKRLPANKQISFAFGALCLVLVLIGGMFFFSLRAIEYWRQTQQARAHQKWEIADQLPRNVGLRQAEVVHQLLDTDGEEMARHEQTIRNLDRASGRILTDFEVLLDDEMERQIFARLVQARKMYLDRTQELLALSRNPLDADATKEALIRQSPAFFEYQGVASELIEEAKKSASQSRADTSRLIGQLLRNGVVLIGLAMLITVGTGFTVVRITRRLRAANATLQNEITARKGTEVNLRESEEKFRQLADNVTDVFYIASRDLKKLHYVSPAYEKIWGRSLEGLFATPSQWTEAILPEERVGVAAAFGQLAADTPSVSRVFRIARPDGEIRWIFSRGFQIKDAMGQVIRIGGTATDITEHKRAEEAIKQGDARYRNLFEGNPLPMWVYDLETFSFLEVNDAAIAHYGYTRAEFMAMTIADIRPDTDRARLRSNVLCIRNGAPDGTENWRHRKKDGSIIEVEITSHGFQHDGRRARLILALDVTERKRSDQALREAEAKYRSIFENSNDGIFQNTPNGRMISANPALARMLGYDSPEELILGRTFLGHQSYVNSELREEFQCLLEKQGFVRNFEYEIRRKDRSKIWVSEDTRLIRDEKGAAVLYEGSVRDITERKRFEAEREVISEIVQGLVTTKDLEELLALAHRSIGRLLYAKNCFVGLHEAETDLIRFEFWMDERDPVPPPQPISNGFTRSSYVLRTGVPLLLTAERRDQLFEQGKLAQSGSNSASWLGVPLRTPTRTIGVLAVQHYEKDNAYSERDLEFLASVGNQIALAIERKMAEAALRESERAQREIATQLESERARLVAAQSVAKVGSWETDLVRHTVGWSAETYRIFETTPAKFDGTHAALMEIVHPDDRVAMEAAFTRSLGQAGPFTFEHRLLLPDGGITFVEERWKIVFDEQNHPIRAVGTCQDITERKSTELEIERTLGRLNEAQRIGQIGDWEWDMGSGAIAWSPQVFEIFGRDSSLGPPRDYESYLALYDAENGALLKEKIAQVLQTGETQTHELALQRPNGDRIYLEGMVVPRKYEREILVGLFGTVQDITARKQAEEKSRKSEVNLANAQRIAQLGSWEYDIPSGSVHCSDEVYRIFGRAAQEFVPSYDTFVAITHPADREAVCAAFDGALAGGAPFSIDHRIIRGDGTERIVHQQAEITFDPAGDALSVAGTVKDITEHKRDEETLRVSEERLRAALAASSTGTFRWDIRLNELSWDDSLDALFGLPPGKTVRSLDNFIAAVHPEDRPGVIEGCERCAREGADFAMEFRVLWPDGSLHWLDDKGKTTCDAAGQPLYMTGACVDITERKQADAALQASEQRYHSLFENMLEGYAYCRTHFEGDELRDFTYLEVNGAFEALTGLKEVAGKKVSDLIPGIRESNRELFDLYGRVALTGTPEKFQTYVKPLGIWLSITVYSTNREHFVAVFDNITTRKFAEEALRTSEKEFRSLAEAMPQMVWITRPNGQNIYFSQQWMDYTGLTLEESLGDGWIKPFHPDDRQRAAEAWAQATATIGTYSVECRLRRADGVYRWWLTRGVPVRDGSGSIVKWFGTCTDIHDLKMADAALRESSEKFQQLANNIVDAFWIRSPDAREVHYVSPAFETIWGRTVESLYANPHEWTNFIFPEDRPSVVAAYAELAKDTPSIDLEYRIVRPDGELRWVHVRGFQVRDDAGAVIRLNGIVTDITARKQADDELAQSREALQQLNTDLESRVGQRTTALLRATEEADRANRAKSDFLSRTSHELRTPLNAILGFGQLLEMEEDFGPEPRESVEQILNAGRHLLTLIDEVLDISSAESGSILLSPEPLEVEQVLNEVLSLVRPLCSTMQVRLEPPKFLEGDWFVLADSQRLRQVLLNVLGNAIKYNRPGGNVQVECALVENAEPPAFRFCVKDTGPGISAENLARICTPFDRLGADRKQPHIIGTGLGLSLSKRLIELMGGVLGIESVVGEGSTFWIDVPLLPNAIVEAA